MSYFSCFVFLSDEREREKRKKKGGGFCLRNEIFEDFSYSSIIDMHIKLISPVLGHR